VATGVPLDELPPSVLYDVFQDSASVLTGLYLERERSKVTAAPPSPAQHHNSLATSASSLVVFPTRQPGAD
jgi:hypothetical protein